MNNVKLVKKFDKQAKMYDKKRNKLELGALRRRLISSANGKVLEVGVGAGANFPFYRSDVELTAVDFSPAMIEKAKAANDQSFGLNIDYVVGGVEELALPNQSFDTVVSTLSLCAYQSPEAVLHKFHSWCKPNGKILLMEHGISSSKALAFAQKVLNPLAYKFSGCHHNRDIMGLIASAPFTVEKVEHYMTGMLHVIWCRA